MRIKCVTFHKLSSMIVNPISLKSFFVNRIGTIVNASTAKFKHGDQSVNDWKGSNSIILGTSTPSGLPLLPAIVPESRRHSRHSNFKSPALRIGNSYFSTWAAFAKMPESSALEWGIPYIMYLCRIGKFPGMMNGEGVPGEESINLTQVA